MLYFIRHGQTEENVKNILTGRRDIPLNETGVKQVEEEGDNCKKRYYYKIMNLSYKEKKAYERH